MAKRKDNRRYKERALQVVENIKKLLYNFYIKFMYTSIDSYDFTMDMYIKIVVDSNLKSLRKYPIYIPKFVYNKVYQNIIKQYIEISGNEEIKRKKDNQDRIDKLIIQHGILRASYIVLATDISEEKKELIKPLLRTLGIESIEEIEAELKGIELKIDELNEILKSEKKENKKPTRHDFANIFQVLHKNNYKAGDDMSVIDYIEAITLFKKEIKELERR